MASPKKKRIDCSVCKLTFDEDHGVWVCLNQHRHYSASFEPSSQQRQQESNQKKLRREEVPRSSLPSTLAENLNDSPMTLF